MADFGNALTGAATGAGIGSPFGPIGAAAGGLLGGLSGLFGFGKSKPEKIKQLQNYTPEQQALIRERLQMARQGDQQAMQWIRSILGDDPEAYGDFERPALEQFNQQVVPGILERFNIGSGSKASSGINTALGQAARGLSSDLAAQRANLKLSALDQLNNYATTGLSSMTTPYIKGGSKGAWEMLAPAAGLGYASLLNRGPSQTPKASSVPGPYVGMAGVAGAGGY